MLCGNCPDWNYKRYEMTEQEQREEYDRQMNTFGKVIGRCEKGHPVPMFHYESCHYDGSKYIDILHLITKLQQLNTDFIIGRDKKSNQYFVRINMPNGSRITSYNDTMHNAIKDALNTYEEVI